MRFASPTPERVNGTLHRTVNRFLDRISLRTRSRERGVRIVNGQVRGFLKSLHRKYPQFSRLMRLNQRLHGIWR